MGVLIFSGGLDPQTPPLHAQLLVQNLPNAHLSYFPDSNHICTVYPEKNQKQTDPSCGFKIISAFIKGGLAAVPDAEVCLDNLQTLQFSTASQNSFSLLALVAFLFPSL